MRPAFLLNDSKVYTRLEIMKLLRDPGKKLVVQICLMSSLVGCNSMPVYVNPKGDNLVDVVTEIQGNIRIHIETSPGCVESKQWQDITAELSGFSPLLFRHIKLLAGQPVVVRTGQTHLCKQNTASFIPDPGKQYLIMADTSLNGQLCVLQISETTYSLVDGLPLKYFKREAFGAKHARLKTGDKIGPSSYQRGRGAIPGC